MARLKQIQARTDLGYFGAALVDCKNGYNIGGVIRAAGAFNGKFMTVSGNRWENKGNWMNMDTEGGHLRFPVYLGVDDVFKYMPYACEPVAVELSEGASDLVDFVHPKVAMYVFGPEDGAIPESVSQKCQKKIYIPSEYCLNLYSAASIVFYDRMAKSLGTSQKEKGCPNCEHVHWAAINELGARKCNACGSIYTTKLNSVV